jgi:glutamate-1-semialdehyde 2,1-aminomutase
MLIGLGLAVTLLVVLAPRAWARLQLSRAKHPSLAGHGRLAKRLARLVPPYAYRDHEFFAVDRAPEDVARARRDGFMRLATRLREQAPRTAAATAAMTPFVSDMQFIEHYRVPFQFAPIVGEYLPTTAFLRRSDGVTVTDLDGNTFYDLAGR